MAVRSLLAPWIGGANQPPPSGNFSMLAPWLGGAGGVNTAPGYFSMLAPWAGGAGGVEDDTQPPARRRLVRPGTSFAGRPIALEDPLGNNNLALLLCSSELL